MKATVWSLAVYATYSLTQVMYLNLLYTMYTVYSSILILLYCLFIYPHICHYFSCCISLVCVHCY